MELVDEHRATDLLIRRESWVRHHLQEILPPQTQMRTAGFSVERSNEDFHRLKPGVTSCPPVLAYRGLREGVIRESFLDEF